MFNGNTYIAIDKYLMLYMDDVSQVLFINGSTKNQLYGGLAIETPEVSSKSFTMCNDEPTISNHNFGVALLSETTLYSTTSNDQLKSIAALHTSQVGRRFPGHDTQQGCQVLQDR